MSWVTTIFWNQSKLRIIYLCCNIKITSAFLISRIHPQLAFGSHDRWTTGWRPRRLRRSCVARRSTPGRSTRWAAVAEYSHDAAVCTFTPSPHDRLFRVMHLNMSNIIRDLRSFTCKHNSLYLSYLENTNDYVFLCNRKLYKIQICPVRDKMFLF